MNKLMQIYQSFPTVGRQRLIAEWYRDLPRSYTYPTFPAYWALAKECTIYANMLRTRYVVIEVGNESPYKSAPRMFLDLAAGQFAVSNRNCVHPIFTVQENISFRIVHDIMGHYASGGQFDWQGEILACSAHAENLSELAQQALFTDCIAQVAYHETYGEFGEQKVGVR